MRVRRNKAKTNEWGAIYRQWMEAVENRPEQVRAVLADTFPHLVKMGADAATFDYMISILTPVLQMRAITGMGPEDGDPWLGTIFDGQHR